MRRKESKDLLKTVVERYKIMAKADYDNRRDALEDIEFVNLPGEQWDRNMKEARGDRPCYEYNKVRVRCKRVVNDIRDNRPQGKVRAVEGGDTDIAKIYDGLIRNILNTSHADNATDYACEFQVEGGMGAWRINTKYADDSAFNQDIVVEGIENPFNLYCDPTATDFMKRDAHDWTFTERISHREFEEEYGEKADKVDFEVESQVDTEDSDEWLDEETVRVAEYWYKKPVKKTLLLYEFPDPENEGQTKQIVVGPDTDEAEALLVAGMDPAATREVETHDIMMVVASGKKILKGPVKWAGRFFPWVMVYGEYKVIKNKKTWWGLVRHAKDAQRNLNISKTNIAESVALASKAKDWATPKQAEGLEDQWTRAHNENLPFQFYNHDPQEPGPPQRKGGADVPVAFMQQAAIDNEDLKDVMGLPDASMGSQGDEKSGRAIYARQQQGEIATFNYKDNMAKAMELTHELIIDLIPEIYDSERELRILGSDGKEDYKRVNHFAPGLDDDGNAVRVNDLSMGKYDVTITSGPAFSTLRQEAAETYGQLGQQFPEMMPVAGDLIMKSMDLPYSEDIAERLQTLLPPPIQEMLNQDSEQEIPPEVMQMMQQAKQAMQQVEEQSQMVQAAGMEVEQEKALAEKAKAEIKTELANVRAARAEFDAHIAEKLAGLTTTEAGITTREAGIATKGAELKEAAVSLGQEKIGEMLDVGQASAKAASLDGVVAKFMKAVDDAMIAIDSRTSQVEVKTERKPVGGQIRKDGGKISADVLFDDGSQKTLSAVRDQGALRIVGDADPEDPPAA